MPLPGAFPSLLLAPLLPHRHLQSSAATGNRTCCGEIAQKTGVSFGFSVKASLCWRLGLQNTLVVHLSLDQAAAPAWRGLAPQEQVGTDRTGTQGHSCPLSLHTHPRLSMQPHSNGEALAAPMAGMTPSLAGTGAKVLFLYLKISI